MWLKPALTLNNTRAVLLFMSMARRKEAGYMREEISCNWIKHPGEINLADIRRKASPSKFKSHLTTHSHHPINPPENEEVSASLGTAHDDAKHPPRHQQRAKKRRCLLNNWWKFHLFLRQFRMFFLFTKFPYISIRPYVCLYTYEYEKTSTCSLGINIGGSFSIENCSPYIEASLFSSTFLSFPNIFTIHSAYIDLFVCAFECVSPQKSVESKIELKSSWTQ